MSITIHKKTISISPPSMDRSPKNMTDHNMFKTSCIPKIEIAILTSRLSNPSRHMRKSAIPIRINKVVHMGPNAQLGGVHAGFDIMANHVGIEENVAMEPIKPAINGINMDIISFGISDFLKASIKRLLDI